MSFNFENERSAETVETEIVSRAVTRLSTVGGGQIRGTRKFFNFKKNLRKILNEWIVLNDFRS